MEVDLSTICRGMDEELVEKVESIKVSERVESTTDDLIQSTSPELEHQ